MNMKKAQKSYHYREDLLYMINALKQVVHLKEEQQVLIVLQLNTDEKIDRWFEWLKTKIIGENEIDATATEIVRAAVHINQGLI